MKDDLVVLAADDNLDDLEILELCLARTDVRVRLVTVHNGEELAALLRSDTNTEFDLVLLDLNMPFKDGRKALREIRELGIQVPIAVLTTSADPADVRDSYNAGANAYFVKPHDPSQFTRLLRALLEHWRWAQTSRPIQGGT